MNHEFFCQDREFIRAKEFLECEMDSDELAALFFKPSSILLE